MKKHLKLKIPKPVLLLGFTSLLTDVAGEMIYPVLPIFLTQALGASVLFIGVLEGAADSLSSLTKVVSGYYSDRLKRRQPFVAAGYALTGLVRPLLGFCWTPWQVFMIRFLDRLGKGIRTAPRDAWISSLATPGTRGYLFGFHRAMDHAGAVIGPLIASLFLLFWPGNFRTLFLLTLIPGVLALLFVLAAKATNGATSAAHPQEEARAETRSTTPLPSSLKLYFAILFLFTLGNSSDAFLLLKLKESGIHEAWLPALWAGLHVVKSGASPFGGKLSDKIGRTQAIAIGWLIYAGIYLGFGWIQHTWAIAALFMFYGIYYALTESPEKALIADLVPIESQGRAFGVFHAVLGFGALPASLLFGAIWEKAGSAIAFSFGAMLALAAALLLLGWIRFYKFYGISSTQP
jgi:MFS family permease